MNKYRTRDCEAFQKYRRRARCKNILRGFSVPERVTESNMDDIMCKHTVKVMLAAGKIRKREALK